MDNLPIWLKACYDVWSKPLKSLIQNYYTMSEQNVFNESQKRGARMLIEEFIDSEIQWESELYSEMNRERWHMEYGSEFQDYTDKCIETIQEWLNAEFYYNIAQWGDVYEQYTNMMHYLSNNK
jgi:hypothetical protein